MDNKLICQENIELNCLMNSESKCLNDNELNKIKPKCYYTSIKLLLDDQIFITALQNIILDYIRIEIIDARVLQSFIKFLKIKNSGCRKTFEHNSGTSIGADHRSKTGIFESMIPKSEMPIGPKSEIPIGPKSEIPIGPKSEMPIGPKSEMPTEGDQNYEVLNLIIDSIEKEFGDEYASIINECKNCNKMANGDYTQMVLSGINYSYVFRKYCKGIKNRFLNFMPSNILTSEPSFILRFLDKDKNIIHIDLNTGSRRSTSAQLLNTDMTLSIGKSPQLSIETVLSNFLNSCVPDLNFTFAFVSDYRYDMPILNIQQSQTSLY